MLVLVLVLLEFPAQVLLDQEHGLALGQLHGGFRLCDSLGQTCLEGLKQCDV